MSTTTRSSLDALIRFLGQLDQAKIWYRLEHVRDSIMIVATVPGQRWEIEFLEDGEIEVERFISSGQIEGAELLERLVAEHGS